MHVSTARLFVGNHFATDLESRSDWRKNNAQQQMDIVAILRRRQKGKKNEEDKAENPLLQSTAGRDCGNTLHNLPVLGF